MDVDEIRGALAGHPFADVRLVAETGSTNADVVALAREGAVEGIVVVADHQTQGRGRLDRSWQAPPGSSLLLSILTRPAGLRVDELHLVSMAVGVAAAEAARQVTGADVRLKWPNDLVVDVDRSTEGGGAGPVTRKLSGILAESVLVGDHIDAVIVGIGINVNWPTDLPTDLTEIAIALNHLTDAPVDRTEVLVTLLAAFGTIYGSLATPGGPDALLGRYRELSGTLGREVRVELDAETVVGRAVDVTIDGHLLVASTDGGPTREIVAGDVIHARPTGR